MLTYENATPELLKNKQQMRDKLFEAWKKTEQECRDMRTVLGLDDPSFMTYVGAEEDEKLKRYNKLFYQLCEEDQSFCGLYASNPAAGEAELKDRMMLEGTDEQC